MHHHRMSNDPKVTILGKANHANIGSFGGNRTKGASSSKGPWGQSKDAKVLPSLTFLTKV